jgi:hypothetical protein
VDKVTGGPGKLFAVLLSIAGVVIIGVTVRQEFLAKKLQPVQAKVIIPAGKSANANDFIRNGKVGISKANSWNVSIRYEYTVEGRMYQGHLASLGGNSFRTEKDARNSLKGLMGDGSVTAWYDKQNPDIAYLDPRPRRSGYQGGIICFMLAFISNIFMDKAYYLLKRKK